MGETTITYKLGARCNEQCITSLFMAGHYKIHYYQGIKERSYEAPFFAFNEVDNALFGLHVLACDRKNTVIWRCEATLCPQQYHHGTWIPSLATSDAGIALYWEHFLEGGHYAIKFEDGDNYRLLEGVLPGTILCTEITLLECVWKPEDHPDFF